MITEVPQRRDEGLHGFDGILHAVELAGIRVEQGIAESRELADGIEARPTGCAGEGGPVRVVSFTDNHERPLLASFSKEQDSFLVEIDARRDPQVQITKSVFSLHEGTVEKIGRLLKRLRGQSLGRHGWGYTGLLTDQDLDGVARV